MPREEFLNQQQSALVHRLLRELKEKHGTQRAVAEVVGVSQQTISRYLADDSQPVGLRLAKSLAESGLLDWGRLVSSPSEASSGFTVTPPRPMLVRERSNRARAIALLMEDGRGSEEDLRAAADRATKALGASEWQSPLAWVRMIELFLRSVRADEDESPDDGETQ